MKRYKSLFEWLPKEFDKAREKGLLDTPTKQGKDIPGYIVEYALDKWDLDINIPEDFSLLMDILNNIRKNQIDKGKYSVRIVVYKNNFYSIGDSHRESYIHMDIIAYLVLTQGLKLKDYDELLDFNKTSFLKTFLCLELRDMAMPQAKRLQFSESYDRNTQTTAIKVVENNKSYRNIINKILDKENTLFSLFVGDIEGVPMRPKVKGW